MTKLNPAIAGKSSVLSDVTSISGRTLFFFCQHEALLLADTQRRLVTEAWPNRHPHTC
ncbi:hypothetical protein BYT27DRAFT_6896608 [Phlegmacium glaucopus]|nr:hypothetical protein BYT27DRAFT_6896608 [Phlegmacium glaucopus]